MCQEMKPSKKAQIKKDPSSQQKSSLETIGDNVGNKKDKIKIRTFPTWLHSSTNHRIQLESEGSKTKGAMINEGKSELLKKRKRR